jgi:hypothetical protein
MKNFVQLPYLFHKEVEKVKSDEEIDKLGFTCEKKLCEYEGYEEFYDRLWVWTKLDKDSIYIIVTYDQGNSNCELVYVDIYIKEIIDKIKGE